MAGDQELFVAGGASVRIRRIVFAVGFLFSFLALSSLCVARQSPKAEVVTSPISGSERLADAQKAFDAGQFADAARLAHGPENQSADLDFVAGLAFAKLQRWQESRAAFVAGHHKSPKQARFLVELAGVDYKLKDARSAKLELRAALRIDPKDKYTLEFLGTLYFLDGNTEAALKYWNAIEKPRLRKVSVAPPPTLDPALLQNAIGFNAPQILTRDALLGAEARLDNL